MPATEPRLDSKHPHREQLGPDWPSEVQLSFYVICSKEDRWIAREVSFDVVGMGADEQAAKDNMIELLIDYLTLCWAEDATWDDVLRPIPLIDRVRLATLTRLTSLHAHLSSATRRSSSTLSLARLRAAA